MAVRFWPLLSVGLAGAACATTAPEPTEKPRAGVLSDEEHGWLIGADRKDAQRTPTDGLRAATRKALDNHARDFARCQRQNADATGRLYLEFFVDAVGHITDVHANADSTTPPGLTQCMVHAVEVITIAWRDPDGAAMRITYPFRFRPQSAQQAPLDDPEESGGD